MNYQTLPDLQIRDLNPEGFSFSTMKDFFLPSGFFIAYEMQTRLWSMLYSDLDILSDYWHA